MQKLFIYLFLLLPTLHFAVPVPIPVNAWGKIKTFSWNGKTALLLPEKLADKIVLSVIYQDQEFELQYKEEHKSGKVYTTFLPPTEFNPSESFKLKVTRIDKTLFNTYTVTIQLDKDPPMLKILSISPEITHGGVGTVVFQSDKKNQLKTLALYDEKLISYYPFTFIKDGYYSIIFPWYSDHSQDFSHKKIIAIDYAGNTNIISLNTSTKTRNYVNKIIRLPANYAKQKAKELALSPKEMKKMEGNIKEINKVLAQQKKADRWGLTRLSFKQALNITITNPILFSVPSIPLSNAVYTSTYGDVRRYTYQKKTVRHSIHRGIDMASVKNSPVYAVLDGKVVYSDWNSGNGKTIILAHGYGVYTFYAHNEELLVKVGDKVKSGHQIAISGTTGQSTGDHLHLSVIVQGMYVEPAEWLNEKIIQNQIYKPLEEAKKIIESQ